MEKNIIKPLNAEISLFIHATEDKNKVVKAVKNIFPSCLSNEIRFEKTFLQGHYKNPIYMLKTYIKEEVRLIALLKNILKRLKEVDNEFNDIREYFDNNKNMYLRLDKQEAFHRKIKLCSTDPIRIKMKFNIIPKSLKKLESILNNQEVVWI